METEKAILFNELAELLSQENGIHQSLINVAQEMNDCARGNDVETLRLKSSIFDNHICGLEKAEERRLDVCGRLQGIFGNSVPSGRMISLIEQCEPTMRKRLKELRAALMDRVSKLKAVNTANVVMFREALGGISASINMMKAAATPKTGYRHRGDFKPNACNVSLFNEVI
jgi:hypothetical protein